MATIKRLDWQKNSANVWQADALGGYYLIQQFPKGCAVSWIFANCVRRVSDDMGSSITDAKQRSKEDLERIIQDCLS